MHNAISWSYSRLERYERCPYAFRLKYMDKIKEPDLQPTVDDSGQAVTPANERGTRIHTGLEQYIDGSSDTMPMEASSFIRHMNVAREKFKQGLAFVEGEWGIGRDWHTTDWWSAWGRLKLDLLILNHPTEPTHALVVDFKGLPVDTLLPTPTGWTTMGQVSVGDQVIGGDGKPCTVTNKSQIKQLPCYRIEFRNGDAVICDEEHLWALTSGKVVSVKELNVGDKIPVMLPAELPEAALPLHPYILGIWLADGKHTSSELTNPEEFIWEKIKSLGYNYSTCKDDGCRNGSILKIRKALQQIGVLGNKHIPVEYLRASKQQRLQLLQGFMDGDGTANNQNVTGYKGKLTRSRNKAVYNSTDLILAQNVLELVRSLGQQPVFSCYKAYGFGKKVTAYTVSWTAIQGVTPFSLPRKRDALDYHRLGWANERTIKDILYLPAQQSTQCIQVDSSDSTYVCTEKWIVTHNTGKSAYNEVKHADQGKLYQAVTFLRYPTLKTATTEFWYLDQYEITSQPHKRPLVPMAIKRYNERVGKIENDTSWLPKPDKFSCKYCGYRTDKTCQFAHKDAV